MKTFKLCFDRLRFAFFLVLVALLTTQPAQALYTELSLSYSYKKVTFDAQNTTESQGLTSSISFYIWDRVALELSYTNSLFVKKESEVDTIGSTQTRTTTQTSDIYETNLQYLLVPDRKATFQPYIKGGAAFIKKKQQVQIGGDFPFEISPQPGWGPSVGIGTKIFLTENLSLRLSYDVVRTPIEGSATADDATGRAGISWMF